MKKDIFFDLSTVATGYSVYEDGRYAASGVIRVDSRKETDGEKRAFHMLNLINALILSYRPDVLHAEKLPPLSHRGQEVSTYLHGGFKFLALSHSVDCETRSVPSHWRKVLGFDQTKGRNLTGNLKKQSIKYAGDIAGKEITDDNEADAICLGRAYFMELAAAGQDTSGSRETDRRKPSC